MTIDNVVRDDFRVLATASERELVPLEASTAAVAVPAMDDPRRINPDLASRIYSHRAARVTAAIVLFAGTVLSFFALFPVVADPVESDDSVAIALAWLGGAIVVATVIAYVVGLVLVRTQFVRVVLRTPGAIANPRLVFDAIEGRGIGIEVASVTAFVGVVTVAIMTIRGHAWSGTQNHALSAVFGMGVAVFMAIPSAAVFEVIARHPRWRTALDSRVVTNAALVIVAVIVVTLFRDPSTRTLVGEGRRVVGSFDLVDSMTKGSDVSMAGILFGGALGVAVGQAAAWLRRRELPPRR